MTATPLLLAGPGSRQLERRAMEEAARLLCRRPGHGEAGIEGCADCRRVARREHPDLQIAAPESLRRANVPDFEGSGGGKETTIPTSLVRAIVAEAARRPYEGDRRVIILLDVDRTESAAFSALLKVLEEPPLSTSFILTATRPRLLPETILSRVVLRSVRGTPRAQTARLLERSGVMPEEAWARAAFVPSDAGAAAELDLASARQGRDDLLEAVSGTLLTGSPAWGVVLGARLAGEDSEETAGRLGLLALLLKDAVAAAADPAGDSVVHRERFEPLERLGRSAPGLLDIAQGALELASGLQESRRNARLAAEAFALSLVEAP